MRSFRSENVSLLVKQVLDLEIGNARSTLESVRRSYAIVMKSSMMTVRMASVHAVTRDRGIEAAIFLPWSPARRAAKGSQKRASGRWDSIAR